MAILPAHLKTLIPGLLLIPAALLAEYRGKTAGDEALRQGEYSTAASFYEQYFQEASSSGDAAGEKDAFERRIDVLILADLPEIAAKQIREYQLRFPGADPIAVTMWDADIQLLRKNPTAAKTGLERILPALTADNPRRVHALLSLARAHEQTGDYSAAAKLYFSIAETGKNKGSKLQTEAWERGIFCLAFTSGGEDPLLMIADHPASSDPASQRRIQLLTAFLAMKADPSLISRTVWEKCKNAGSSDNRLSYPVFSSLADDAFLQGKLEIAAEAYAAAFEFAPGKEDAFQTIRRLIQVIRAAGKKEEAADLALKTLDLFRGDYASAKFKEEVAEILQDAGKYPEAAEMFANLAQNPSAAEEVRHRAMCRLVKLSGKTALPEKTAALLDSYFSGEREGERKYLYAESLLENGKYAQAGSAFVDVAVKYSKWKSLALYQAAFSSLKNANPAPALAMITDLFREKLSPKMEADATFLKARALEDSGKPEEACGEYVKYAEMNGRDESFSVQALLRAGILSFKAGNNAKALEMFDRLIREYPKNPASADAASWKIYIYRTIGDDYRADRATYELSAAWPDSQISFDALYLLAENSFSTDSYYKISQSLKALYQQAKTDENKVRVLCGQAALAICNKRYNTALEYLNRIESEFPNTGALADALYLKADVLRNTGELRKALEMYRKVLLLHPNMYLERAAQGAVGDCLFTIAGKDQSSAGYAEALQAYRVILERKDLDPGLRAMVLFKTGRSAELSGDDDTAVKYYKEAVYLPTAFNSPASRYWGTRSAEAIYSIAEKRPVRHHIEDASAALSLLEKHGIISAGSAEKRTEILKRSRFRPYGKR